MFIVELICSSQGEEKLTPVIMRASICHGNQTSPNETQSGVKFILEIRTKHQIYVNVTFVKQNYVKKHNPDPEWAPIDGLSSCSCSCWISPLNDEFLHHSVKYCAIIVT